MRRLVVSAFGIHTGGGLVLLRELIAAAGDRLALAFLDARFAAEGTAMLGPPRVRPVAASIPARLAALDAAARAARPGDVLLGFNGLAPRGQTQARVILFVQSAIFAGLDAGIAFPPRVALRHRFERALFRLGRANACEAWVQTPTMARALAALHPGLAVLVVPFVDAATPLAEVAIPAAPRAVRLFYPADGAAHKNHARLFRAMRLVGEAGVEASLEVTLPEAAFAARAREAGGVVAGVRTTGPLDRAAVFARLAAADALVFPSLTESFGLPLIEAAGLGVPILAPERDYVRDVCAPAETFDPASSRSIADAIRRFAGAPRAVVAPVSAAAFVERLLAD